ncbi:DJ-1/PfpI family protein [Cohnella fermenti]|uniref:DJ-1/PfpI family protein n=1 Tax=Cohnella fermenti TaxID=2565925 RepID=A0A4S4CB43_9BACL|nr:DJ-1/PfpI family protein [Cohnella fermenti]THF84698.1 DJ-1/PfpI family protein [Cohnella fermenti]
MRIAFVVFNGITFLDFIGFYDVIYRLNLFEETKGTTWDICGLSEEVSDELGLAIKVNKIHPDLSEYDMVYVPGGKGTRRLRFDEEFVSWLRTAERVPYKVSVCTGALLLGAAGMLREKHATTNPNAYELLKPYCKELVRARIVKDGQTITAGGVATSIDLALYIVGLLVNHQAVETVKQQIDYPYSAQEIVEISK